LSLKTYIRNKKPKQFKWYGVDIFIQKDFTSTGVDINQVLSQISRKIPQHLFSGLDAIYVGEFDFLKSRDLDAIFRDGAIFLSNKKVSIDDTADDITHEIAHLVEKEKSNFIYGDGKIEQEFLNKRKELYFILKEEGYEVSLSQFLNPEYDIQFDQYLYQHVGYPALSVLTINLFYSPYGATSLREYFANCFEGFFWNEDLTRVRDLSPKVADKLDQLIDLQEEQY
jgi:hypothetical protein